MTRLAGARATRRLAWPWRLADAVVTRTPWLRDWTSRHYLMGAFQRGAPLAAPDGVRRVVLSFDLDYQRDTDLLPALLDLLAARGVRASFACIGRLVEADPSPYRRAVAEGHEIVNHTWSHPDNPVLAPDREFWHLSVREMQDEIGRAQDGFATLLGVRPRGFRSPHFKDAPRMLEALDAFPEIRWLSSTLSSGIPGGLPYYPVRDADVGPLAHRFTALDAYDNTSRLMLPLTACPEHRWSPFCSYDGLRAPPDAARGAGLHTPAGWEACWRRLLRERRVDGYVSTYFDPLDVVRDAPTTRLFDGMLAHALGEGWQITTLDEAARAWGR